ncbi:hypothetical protein SK128_025792, partial [Halocaridina rubra]
METCGTYNFTITPYFVHPDDPSLDFAGDSVTTVGRTTDETPGPPRNLEITEQTDTGVTVRWTEPSLFPQCVDHYRLCAKLESQQEICVQTTDTTYTSKLELCARYTISVSGISSSGLVGIADTLTFSTITGVPGPVVNLTVDAVGSNFINVTFGRPTENPYCVEGYKYNVRPTKYVWNIIRSMSWIESKREECDPCSAVFYPLSPCTNYTLAVNAYNPSMMDGFVTEKTAKTGEAAPKDPVSIIGTPVGTDSIEVVWEGNPTDPCAGDAVLCWVNDVHPVENCMTYQQGTLGGSQLLFGLLPCSLYTITVIFKSPGGLQSAALVNYTRTLDI